MAIEIVDLPIKNGDFPWFFVGLPEGNWRQWETTDFWGFVRTWVIKESSVVITLAMKKMGN